MVRSPAHWQLGEVQSAATPGERIPAFTPSYYSSFLLPSIIVSNYALFLAVITVYPLRS